MSPSLQPEREAPMDRKPQGCTNLKLRQLMRRVAQRYDAQVGRVGLKGTQYSLLSYVIKLGPIRPVDLAEAMNKTAATVPSVGQGAKWTNR